MASGPYQKPDPEAEPTSNLLEFPQGRGNNRIPESAPTPPPQGGEGGGQLPPPPDDPIGRKLDARRINECLKHFNAFCNTLAAGILAAAAIIPFVKDADATLDANAAQWCLISLGFHIFPYVLNFLAMRSEE